MLPFDVPRSYPPTWVDELRETVLWPDRRWTAAESLSILVACRELQGWLADPRPYEGKQHKWSWLSAVADFQQSVSQLGRELRDVLGQNLVAAVVAADTLQADLASMTHAAMADRLEGRRSADREIFHRLNSRWCEAESRAAAWNDLAEACKDTATSDEVLALRRDLFWELLRAGDYGVDQMSQLLAGVLGDSSFHVIQARVWLGDIAEEDVTLPRPFDSAGLTSDQQLALCERLLVKPPLRGHQVVWVAFDRAGPGTFHRELGPITLWNCEWVREVLEKGGPNLSVIPGELKEKDGFFSPNSLPRERDVMLVRVDLDVGAWTDPVRFAIEQAEAVVALAGFRVGDSKWRQLPGHILAVDGRVRSMGSFGVQFDSRDIATPLYQDRMDAELANLTPRLEAHLPITDPNLSEIVQAVRWVQQAQRQPPLAGILLHVRVLELLSQRVDGSKWYTYLDRYHRATWIRNVMLNRLGDVIDDCLRNYERVVVVEDRIWLKDFGIAIRGHQLGGLYTLDLRRGLDVLPKLVSLFPLHDRLARPVQSAANRLALTALSSWRDELEESWNLTRERLIRVRNTLAHGGPIDDDAAETVSSFVQLLAHWSLSVALEGLLEGQSISEAHALRRQQGDEWTEGLSSAATAIDALTGLPI